jgi:hypothetical protein
VIGIYKITNLVNGKVYIGQSVNIEKRFNKHKTTAFNQNSKSYDYPLYCAIRKYGLDNFSFDVIEECLQSDLNDKEKYYIEKYDACNNGYNQDEGGTAASHYLKLSKDLIIEIINRLKNTNDNSEVIGNEFGVSSRTIREINSGRACHMDGESYPIRPPLSSHPNYVHSIESQTYPCKQNNDGKVAYQCPSCGEYNVTTASKLCITCAHDAQRRAERPEPLELARMVTKIGFRNVGLQYGVSDKAVVKWCKQYKIPHTRKELEKWYRQQIGEPEPEPKRKIDQRMPVEQIDPNTNKVVAVFESTNAAARAFDKKKGTRISDACKNGAIVYGYIWRFASPQTPSSPNPPS